jgi:hypothetical protein
MIMLMHSIIDRSSEPALSSDPDMGNMMHAINPALSSLVLQSAERNTEVVSDGTLLSIATQLDHLRSVVAPFTQPGWLLELVCNERVKEQFDARHNAVVDALRVRPVGGTLDVTAVVCYRVLRGIHLLT